MHNLEQHFTVNTPEPIFKISTPAIPMNSFMFFVAASLGCISSNLLMPYRQCKLQINVKISLASKQSLN